MYLFGNKVGLNAEYKEQILLTCHNALNTLQVSAIIVYILIARSVFIIFCFMVLCKPTKSVVTLMS